MAYASVVIRDSIITVFLISALNDLNIIAGKILNTYLNSPTKEKVLFYSGDYWKSDQGKVVLVVRVIYGLKPSALAMRNYLSEILGNYLGLNYYLTDPYVWYRDSVCKEMFEYYCYILVYVDKILIINKNPQKNTKMIQGKYTTKPRNIVDLKV